MTYPIAVVIKGSVRCATCDTVLRPGHFKKPCCKSGYRQYTAAAAPRATHKGTVS